MAMTLVVSGIAFFIMISANNAMKSRQAEILETYKSEQVAIKALLEQERKLILDSVFNPQQKIALLENMKRHVDEVQEKADINKIEHLLELEFSKIQGEYEVLNLWCALLTVVFLVFSLYSVIKTNEIHGQAEKALKDLAKTSAEASQKSASIDQAVNSAEGRVKTQLEKYSNKAVTRLRELDEKLNTLEQKVESNGTAIDSKNQIIGQFESKVQNAETALRNLLDSKVEEANSNFIGVINSVGNELADKANSQLLDITRRLIKLETIIDASQDSVTHSHHQMEEVSDEIEDEADSEIVDSDEVVEAEPENESETYE